MCKAEHTEGDMATSVKELLAEANKAVPRMSLDEAGKHMSSGDVLVVDVRDTPELESTGKVPGALHVPRGMLEFRADPNTPYYNEAFQKDRTILLYCGSGARSALAGKTLKDLGYEKVYNLGSFKNWIENGGSVEHVVDEGM